MRDAWAFSVQIGSVDARCVHVKRGDEHAEMCWRVGRKFVDVDALLCRFDA